MIGDNLSLQIMAKAGYYTGEDLTLADAYLTGILGNVPRKWVNKTCESDCRIIFQPLQSGYADIEFPVRSFNWLNSIPENVSLSPVLFDSNCVFMNFYSNSSTKTDERGILSPFQIFTPSVYVLIVFLSMVKLLIVYTRSKVNSRTGSNPLIKMINGQTGLMLILISSYSIQNIFHLLSTSFTTDFSISFRDKPIARWSDLKSSPQVECGSVAELQCFSSANKSLHSTNQLHPISADEGFEDYIKPRIYRDRITLFESNFYTPRTVQIFCNEMINTKRDHSFHIHIGTESYYQTPHLIVYYSHMERRKKRWLLKILYSCFEQGYCQDAFDRSSKQSYENVGNGSVENAQCNNLEQFDNQPDGSYRPIKIKNLVDLIKLATGLIGLSVLIIIIELVANKLKLFI